VTTWDGLLCPDLNHERGWRVAGATTAASSPVVDGLDEIDLRRRVPGSSRSLITLVRLLSLPLPSLPSLVSLSFLTSSLSKWQSASTT
jgi:hypothetical protein